MTKPLRVSDLGDRFETHLGQNFFASADLPHEVNAQRHLLPHVGSPAAVALQEIRTQMRLFLNRQENLQSGTWQEAFEHAGHLTKDVRQRFQPLLKTLSEELDSFLDIGTYQI